MAKESRESAAVNARIVYWGIEGAGKTANLRMAHSKLRPDHRGELRQVASRLDPTIHYEELPISLGDVAGTKTQIEMVTVPGRADQGPMRKQLLDQVDGVVLVVDTTAPLDANVESLEELREALAAYGRKLEDTPFIVQYNKCDAADPYALDDIHRGLDAGDVRVFEAVATEGTGVLQTLSTISKRVIRALRETPQPPEFPAPDPDTAARMQDALEAEGSEPDSLALDALVSDAELLFEEANPFAASEISRPAGARLGSDLSIVSVGEATREGDRSVRVPLVLGDADGGTSTVVLTIQLDALVEEDPG